MSQNSQISPTKESNDVLALPKYRGQWQPIYFQPIPYSGELITIAVAVKGVDGNFQVARTVTQKMLTCISGKDKSKNIVELVSVCCRSAENHLKERFSLSSWNPPFSSFSVGSEKEALSIDIDGIVGQATASSSFFASFISRSTEAESPVLSSNEWQKKIRNSMESLNEKSGRYFNYKIPSLNGKFETKVGFYSSEYAANFGVIGAGLKNTVNLLQHFQAKLWQLDQIRDSALLGVPNDFELIIHETSAVISESIKKNTVEEFIDELKQEAARREIGVFNARKPEQVAKHLMDKVA